MRTLFQITLLLISFAITAQKIPSNLNQTTEGKRNGKWTILLDAGWKEISDVQQARYYRVIEYQLGKPIGRVRDYHSNGLLQWEGQLLSENPDVNDGVCIWYFDNGDKKKESAYKNGSRDGKEVNYWQGKKYSEGTYSKEKKNLDWIYYGDDLASHYYAADQDYQRMDSKSALTRYQKALAHAELLNKGTSIEKMNILWSMSYAQMEIGQAKEAALNLATALQLSHKVDGKFDQSLVEDAEKAAKKLVTLKIYESAILLFKEIVRKREAKLWTSNPNYYTDLKGILDNSYWSNQLDSMHFYFDKIAQILPSTDAQLSTHLHDWASFTIPRKEYDRFDVIERACEKFLKAKEHLNEKDKAYCSAWITNGRLAQAKGQNERALKCFENARANLQPQNSSHQETYLSALGYSAEVYHTIGKYDAKAALVFNEFEKWSDQLMDSKGEDYALHFASLAKYYLKLGNYKRAEETLIKSMKAIEAIYGLSSDEYAAMKIFMANVLTQSGQKEKAQAFLSTQAQGEKAIIKGGGLNEAMAEVEELTTALQAGEYIKAVAFFEKRSNQILPFLETNGKYESLIMINLGMGGCYKQTGNLHRAGELFLYSKKLAEQKLAQSHPTRILTIRSLADFYYATGSFREAEDNLLEALNILNETRTKANQSESDEQYFPILELLGFTYIGQDYFREAEKAFNDVLQYYMNRYGEASFEYANASTSLAQLFTRTKQFSKATALYEKALPYFQSKHGEQSTQYVDVERSLANIYLLTGDYTKAEPLYLKAKSIYQQTSGSKGSRYQGALTDLGLLYTYSHQLEKGTAIYHELLQIHQDGIKSIFPSLSEREKTAYYSQVRNHFNSYYAFTLQAWKKNPAEAIDMFNLQLVSKSLLFKSSLRVRQTIQASGDGELIKKLNEWQISKEQLSKVYQMSERDLAKANIDVKALELKINEAEKVLTLKSQSFANLLADRPTWQALRNKLKPGEAAIEMVRINEALPGFTFSYLGKGITYDTLGAEGGMRIVNLADQCSAIKAGLKIGQTIMTINGVSTKGKTFKQLAVLMKDNPINLQLKKNDSKETYVAQISTDSVFARTFPKKVRYVALLVTPTTTTQPEVVLLSNGDDLENRYLKYYKNSILQQQSDAYSYKAFWQPIQQRLPGVEKIFFSPDGVYNSINLNTLYNTETNRFLLDDLEVRQVSNTSDILAPVVQSNSQKAILIGFPDYYFSIKAMAANQTDNIDFQVLKTDSTQRFMKGNQVTTLPGTKVEVDVIENILKLGKMNTSKYTLGDASEEKLKSIQSPRLLHIATHGFFMQDIGEGSDATRGVTGVSANKLQDNPLLRSGLLLAGAGKTINGGQQATQTEDGIFTAYEAMNLDLSKTEMVVLSACETGLGQIQTGEGVYGLQRAFRAAGAQYVLMSLWKVDDVATQKLMSQFYGDWLKINGKAEAFRAAQLKLRQEFPHPYFWGAFVLTGN